MRGRLRVARHQGFHHPEQLRRTVARGRYEPIGPKISLLALALLLLDLYRERAQAFEQLQTQHQRERPEFSDVEWRDRLESDEKFPDDLRLQCTAALRYDLRAHAVNTR